MKLAILGVTLATSLSSSLAFAGWGAIAYNRFNGAASEAHNYNTYAEAATTALSICGYGCTVVSWEHNSCIALATGPGRWGQANGYSDENSAINAAVSFCGSFCSWREWACN